MRYTIFDYLVSTSKTYRTSITTAFFVFLFFSLGIIWTHFIKNPNIENRQTYTGVLTEIGLVKIKKEDSYLFSFNKKVDKSVLKITLDNQKDFFVDSELMDYWSTIKDNMSIGHEYSVIFYIVSESEKVLEIKTEDEIILSSEIRLKQQKQLGILAYISIIISGLFMFILIYKRKQFARKTRGTSQPKSK